MTPSNIKLMVESVGIPSAYYQFAGKTDQQPPFICYFFGNGQDFIADNSNYVRADTLYIELYTDSKDFGLEKQVETVLNSHELVFEKTEVFLDSEHMHETIYTTAIALEV